MRKAIFIFVVLQLLILPEVVSAEERTTLSKRPEPLYEESFVKATYIINFLDFISWQDDKKDDEDIDICVIGDDSIGASLALIISSSNITNVNIEKADYDNRLDLCEIVFLSKSHARDLERILFILNSKPVLTVSDIDGFIDKDGLIGFKIIDETIRIEINKTIADKLGLVFNSKLLQVAMRVI